MPSKTEHWLQTLPVAPEYRPSLAEFQDPIAYIFSIEKEASKYGICKIVPPLPPASNNTVIAYFNKSISNADATFTTRQQHIGFSPRRATPVRLPVWQSGHCYTFQEFEAKAMAFQNTYFNKCVKKTASGGLSELEIETLFWKAIVDKPFSVEYANDMPGSAFAPPPSETGFGRKLREGMTVGDTAWNMKTVARSTLSLLRFMKEDIAGVTSPMLYVAMLFSWFAWHVEDHDLHSLNYLHTGAGKTWYGVPKEAAAAAFEEVVRVHGYGGEINPIVTFATLCEKTTVMTPEIFVKAGIPCCRLVQNPGQFVVTFPRAYHSGFSHGFNCGEASNMATPDWLAIAKEAAVRRASINCPPMVSHFQLLYDLVFALCSSLPMGIQSERSSSRLKQKKAEGETVIKQLFVKDIKESNQLLQLLGEGLPVVLQPRSSALYSIYSKSRNGCLLESRSSVPLRLCERREAIISDKINLAARSFDDGVGSEPLTNPSADGKKFSSTLTSSLSSVPNKSTDPHVSTSNIWDAGYENNNANMDAGVTDKKLFSCVTCGILCFSCVVIIQPAEGALKYLMSSDCDFFTVSQDATKMTSDLLSNLGGGVKTLDHTASSGWIGSRARNAYNVHIQSSSLHIEDGYQCNVENSDNEEQARTTALDLLASAYGNSSDSEDHVIDSDTDHAEGPNFSEVSLNSDFECNNSNARDRLQENDFQCTHITDSDEENQCGKVSENKCSTYDRPSFNLDKLASMGLNLASLQSEKDTTRMHVFCLEHALEVKKKLEPIGGVRMLLLCHPDYPGIEAQAKSVAEELGLDHCWNKTVFRESSEEDERYMATALESAEDVSSNGDWAVKLGMNLFYSASLSRSPLYSKQMPFNSVVYKAFGRVPPSEPPAKFIDHIKRSSKREKVVLLGKWCGKAWMSNEVHPLLLPPALDEEQLEVLHVHSSAETDSGFIQEVISAKSRRAQIAAITSIKAVRTKRQIVVYSRSNKKTKRAETGQSVSASDPIDAGNARIHQKPKLYCRSKHKIRGNLKLMEEASPILYHKSKHVANGGFDYARETTSLHDLCKPNFKPFGADVDDETGGGPSTRLRERSMKPRFELEAKPALKKGISQKKSPAQKGQAGRKMKETVVKPKKSKATADTARSTKRKDEEWKFQCDIEGCTMSFSQKQELSFHKRNVCPVKGCGKNFLSHKYLLQHRRVHEDDRPLKCPWKECKMSFKWAWARTEHIRVHNGARPYMCVEAGCGQTFRFVSDFSRHKRKTGHSVKKTIKC